MTIIDTVVIGAGHAGLAVSRLLTEAGREHVVLDRGRVGERWRTERWDSLHLLTPNWMTRLPGWSYGGSEPEGYMSARRLVRHLERYAASFAAPVVGGTTVEDLSAGNGRLDGLDGRWVVGTDRGTWRARHVIIAAGPHSAPHVATESLSGLVRRAQPVRPDLNRRPVLARLAARVGNERKRQAGRRLMAWHGPVPGRGGRSRRRPSAAHSGARNSRMRSSASAA